MDVKCVFAGWKKRVRASCRFDLSISEPSLLVCTTSLTRTRLHPLEQRKIRKHDGANTDAVQWFISVSKLQTLDGIFFLKEHHLNTPIQRSHSGKKIKNGRHGTDSCVHTLIFKYIQSYVWHHRRVVHLCLLPICVVVCLFVCCGFCFWLCFKDSKHQGFHDHRVAQTN